MIVKNGRAVGLTYLQHGKEQIAHAENEIVLSGGAVNSPKLLLLSGIGPADDLHALGIDVVHDLPGVGKNLQDHMDVYIAAECSQPVSYNGEDRWFKAIPHGIQYLLYKTGPVTACVAEAGCFIRSSEDVRYPDIQIHCLPAYVVDHGRMRIKGHGVTINTCHLRRVERMQSLAKELGAVHPSVRVVVEECDLSNTQAISAMARRLEAIGLEVPMQ